MQAIHTKYLPPSPTGGRGPRIKATCARGSITIPQEQADTAHERAVKALIEKFLSEDEKTGTPRDGNPWNKPFISGGLADGSMVHVFGFDLNAIFRSADDEAVTEAIGRAIAYEFMLRKDREHKDRWQTKGGTFRARGIACRAARIFLETTKNGWEGRTK